MKYNDKLTPADQVDMEEDIAFLIFETTKEENETYEETCADLGRTILKRVLAKFRPDLFKKNS